MLKNEDVLKANEARLVLKKEAQEAINQCRVEIQEVLDRYGCRIEVSMVIKATGNIPQVAIVRNH